MLIVQDSQMLMLSVGMLVLATVFGLLPRIRSDNTDARGAAL